jgi:TRAP-type C4-dicarboxylate transport system permease small subunit
VRALLNGLYLVSGVLAGIFLVGIGVLILAQVIARTLGLHLPSADEISGYCLAASSFLGLAATYRRAEHIRVGLVIERLSPRWRRPVELWCLAAAVFLLVYFAWYAVDMVWWSYVLNDVSQGLLPIPLWIPQTGIAAGLAVMAVALIDDLIVLLAGGTPSYLAARSGEHGPGFER